MDDFALGGVGGSFFLPRSLRAVQTHTVTDGWLPPPTGMAVTTTIMVRLKKQALGHIDHPGARRRGLCGEILVPHALPRKVAVSDRKQHAVNQAKAQHGAGRQERHHRKQHVRRHLQQPARKSCSSPARGKSHVSLLLQVSGGGVEEVLVPA